jgi:hypothetical protein
VTAEHHDATTPAGSDLPAGWCLAPEPPEWVLEQTSDATGWANAGERRWRATLPKSFAPMLLLAVNDAGTRFAQYAVDLDGEPDAAEVIEQTFGHMQNQLAHEDLPTCAKPGCSEKAPRTFTAAEPGPLAGRQREPGEEIHFCPRHGHDVYCAASGGPLADWLKPDAVRLNPIDAMWAAAFAGDNAAYDEAVARLRRLTAFHPTSDR